MDGSRLTAETAETAEGEDEDQDQEKGEEEEQVEDPCVELEEKESGRDRSKVARFTAMMKSGELPPWLVELYQKAKASKKGDSRERVTQIINCAFDRQEGGKLLLSLSKPFFQQSREIVNEKRRWPKPQR